MMKKLYFGVLSFLFLFKAHAEPMHLHMLAWEGYAPPEMVKAFIAKKKKEKVEVVIDVQNVINNDEFFEAARSGKYEIITPTHNLLRDYRYNYITKNLILPLDLKNIPNFKDITPSLQTEKYFNENGKVYAIPFVGGPYGLIYNRGKMEKAPESWNELWNPKNSKKYKIVDEYPEVNIFVTGLVLGYKGQDLGNYEKINNPVFKKKLQDLVVNSAGFWLAVDKPEDFVGMKLGTSWGFALPGLKAKGEDWKMVTPKEGVTVWQDNYAVTQILSNKPALKKLAEEWINFAISPEYQEAVVVKQLGSIPSNTKTQNFATPEEIANYHLADLENFRKTQVMWPTFNSIRDHNGVKRLWKDAREAFKK